MNRTIVALLISTMFFAAGCFSEESKKDDEVGYKLTVTINYTGGSPVGTTHGDVSFDIFTNTTDFTANEGDACIGGSWWDTTTGGTMTDFIAPGNYYIVAYYDLDDSFNLSTGDSYGIYDGDSIPGNANAIDMTSGGQSISITFNNDNIWP
ncbi:MAG: hypothetical protein EPN93_14615 [Spirochaetes bacterium]|nr:MAG: hypothetical protein EPN93_14615 [Spirochaetota bacterium]